MLPARVKVLLLSYQLLSFYVSRTRQSEVIDNTVFIYFETETIPMPVDTTAVYILSSLPSQSRTSSSIAVTSELSSLPVSSLNTIEVTVPLVTPTTSVMLISTVVVTSVVAGTTEGSSASGGVIAGIVVGALVLVAVAAVVVIILLVYIQRKKRTKRKYSFTKSTETVYLNVSTTLPTQDPPCVENDYQSKGDGITLNQSTTSPRKESNYHIYEMAEMTDDELIGEPQGSQEEGVPEASDVPDERSGTAPSRRRRTAYSWGSKNHKQRKSSQGPRVPPRRYNTMSEYEFMRPQLQAAAANAAKKRTRLPSDEGENPYSEIGEDRKSQQSEQSDNYIFMRTGRPSAQFSSFLSKWLENIKKDDTSVTTDQTDQSGQDQSLSQVNEEDVYITMD